MDRTMIYYIALIDILQVYDLKKKSEVFYKTIVLRHSKVQFLHDQFNAP
jgi:hypothetical protein